MIYTLSCYIIFKISSLAKLLNVYSQYLKDEYNMVSHKWEKINQYFKNRNLKEVLP